MGDNVAGWEQLDYREEQRTDGGLFRVQLLLHSTWPVHTIQRQLPEESTRSEMITQCYDKKGTKDRKIWQIQAVGNRKERAGG